LIEEVGRAQPGRRGCKLSRLPTADELSRDQLDDKLDYTNRAQGTLASASTKELTVATISLTGGEPVGRLNDHFRTGAKALLGLQLRRSTST
jgi:hypothetical protein